MVAAHSRTAARILRVLPRERITRLVGVLGSARLPPVVLRPLLGVYTRAYGVDMSEAEVPAQGFRSFNEFFTRRLREGLRTVEGDPRAVASPADGRIEDAGPIDATQGFQVKGQPYDTATLLGSEADAERFGGGHYAVVYLSPRDYHRVHSPVTGRVVTVRHIPGTLFPVNAIGVRHVPLLFARNERIVVLIETEALGTLAVVLVGAFVVGRIALAFEAPPRPPHGGPVVTRHYEAPEAPPVSKGGELGSFLLGSTVVVLLPQAASGRWRMAEASPDLTTRVGQALAWLEAEGEG